ncbi:MAG: hypothetical protein PHR61_01240 [Candidatus Absconditabacteria bacterium]|nr:hypothetical protein [Candidatus Absconditabacteria bacterium]
MTTIKAVNDGYLLDNKLLFGASEPENKYINLAKTIGEDMRYQKIDYSLVDYPGEYDIQDVTIQCFLGKNNLLNYLIVYGNKRIALLQSPDILESTADFAVAQEWVYTDDTVLAKLEQLEVEGKKIKLEQLTVEEGKVDVVEEKKVDVAEDEKVNLGNE